MVCALCRCWKDGEDPGCERTLLERGEVVYREGLSLDDRCQRRQIAWWSRLRVVQEEFPTPSGVGLPFKYLNRVVIAHGVCDARAWRHVYVIWKKTI